jgi:hypothetical protein
MNKVNARAVALLTTLEMVPPIIREELLSDKKLLDEFGLKVDPVLEIGPDVGSFKVSELHAAVNAASRSGGGVAALLDVKGAEWTVRAKITSSKASLLIQSPSRTVRADSLFLSTQNRKARRLAFASQVKSKSCGKALEMRWGDIIARRGLSQSELRTFEEDVARTPEAVSAAIMLGLRQQELPLEVLVPRSLEYYERLVGRHDGRANIGEYIEHVAIKHIEELLKWDKTEGLRAAMLLGSHSLISDVLARQHISSTAFTKLAQWAGQADPMSRAVVLELALKRSRGLAECAAHVQLVAQSLCKAEQEEVLDLFAIFSVVFRMVDGELGKLRVAASKPPFWRRLASMAHAGVITRCLLAGGRVPAEVLEQMGSIRLTEYQMQGIVDMRTEPRWHADFASSMQLRSEFGGRVFGAARQNEKVAMALGVWDLLLSDTPGGLKSGLNMRSIGLPGPLEGNVEPGQRLDEEILQKMRASLTDLALSILSFALVSNTALFVKLPQDVLTLAAEAVRRANYHIDPRGKPEWVETCLVNLATAAAVNRCPQLADEMFIVLRSYRRLFRGELSLDATVRVGLIACGSRMELGEWSRCVGAPD